MYKNILTVWGENLAKADLSKTATPGDAVRAGGTSGALVVYIIAETVVTVASTCSVTVSSGGSATGTFGTTIETKTLKTGSYAAGECIASISLPDTVEDFVIASVVGNTSSSGNICVTLGYLAR